MPQFHTTWQLRCTSPWSFTDKAPFRVVPYHSYDTYLVASGSLSFVSGLLRIKMPTFSSLFVGNNRAIRLLQDFKHHHTTARAGRKSRQHGEQW